MKNIEFKGVKLSNIGSKMMLLSLQEKLKESYKIKCIVNSNVSNPYEDRIALGLHQKLWFFKFNKFLSPFIEYFIPNKLCQYLGIVKSDDIDVLFDISGYAYNDEWGLKEMKKYIKYYKYLKRKGTKIILMPQALGPFSSSKIKKTFKEFSSCFDLIYARDSYSLKIANELSIKDIKYSPDFTSFIKVEKDKKYENYFVIVPNVRMLDVSNEYKKLIISLLENILSLNKKPLFLLHEIKEDNQFVKDIPKSLLKNAEIVIEKDSKQVKVILSSCYAVISSRYHALITSLNAEVITFGTSWSHKYDELFNLYGYNGLIANKNDIQKKFSIFNNPIDLMEIKNKIKNQNFKNSKLIKKMWEEIIYIIEK